MSLGPGSRLGPYEIHAAIGAGGMGEVYRARDTRLKRDVALKLLPDSFATDPDRLARFQREAEVLASLNHPHIAALYGIEEGPPEGGHYAPSDVVSGLSRTTRALVMELVDGDTLAERIAQGPLPVDEALRMARQIAEALQAAHEQGIIHRDLKPANIKIRSDDTVKVLDFGLAKAMEAAPAAAGALSLSPTITSPAMTAAGMLLGTAAYMAPEQAKGRAADKRSDVWAFGCVLFEMLTGKRAFAGVDVADTLAAVLRSEPDGNALPAGTPAAVRSLLRGCLAKDRQARIGDIAVALFTLGDMHTIAPVPQNTVRRMRRRTALVGAAALVAGGAAVAAAVWWTMRAAPPRVERFTIAPPGAAAPVVNDTDRDIAISPDGSRIVYVGSTGTQLFVRTIGELEPTLLASGIELRAPVVSPDGQWVGFVDGTTTLKKVTITGGPPVVVTSMDSGSRGLAWAPDESFIFATSNGATGLQRVPAAGGEVTVLTKPDSARGESDHLWPEPLPDGRAVLFTIVQATGGSDASEIAALDLETGVQKVVLRGGSGARYVRTGHLLYTAGSTLRAVAFDLDQLETRGAPVPVVPRVAVTTQGAGDYALAADGTLVYADDFGTDASQTRTLVWVDREGREEPLAAPARVYTTPRLSPDGARVAVSTADQEFDIWVADLARRTLTRLTFEAGPDGSPVWTPDGRQIVWNSRGSTNGLVVRAADGTGGVQRLTQATNQQTPTSVTPDGTRVVFHELSAAREDLMLLTLDGRKVQPVLQTPFRERNGAISPDGRWLAYESNASGRFEVYVRPFPDVNGGQWQVSTAGGALPAWARNGRELFFLGLDSVLMAVRVDARGATWTASQPVKILDARPVMGSDLLQYDVSPDGRFLMMKPAGESHTAAPPQIVVVKNWFEELKRLVPVN